MKEMQSGGLEDQGVEPLLPSWRVDDGSLSPQVIEDVQQLLDAHDRERLIGLLEPMHAADIGDIIESLSRDERVPFVSLLGEEFDFESLTEIDESIRVDLLERLPNADLAQGMSSLENDDAVFILEDIEAPDREAIMALMPEFERLVLRRSLEFPEDSAGRRMQSDFIAVPPFWNVGQAIDYMRAADDLPTEFYQIYVVDPTYHLQGTVPLDRILRATRDTEIADIADDQVIMIEANDDQEDAAYQFERFDLVEVGVVDEDRRLLGVITVDDMVDVIHEEAEEDIRRLVGMGDEEVSDNVWSAVRSRVTWLLVNLVTAVLASAVIGLFDASLEQMVALAVLMPIVASMGGNAGTQTMTVTVRAISTHDLSQFNVARLIARETLVGIVNGAIFALVLGFVAAIWFANPALGVVIGVAMVVNMFAAGLSGIVIPLILNKFKIDPAVASSAFVTTVTDVVGFVAFLGLAAYWFGLG